MLFVIEGVYGESFHRMDLIFLCDYLGNARNANLQGDTNQVGFDWLDLSNNIIQHFANYVIPRLEEYFFKTKKNRSDKNHVARFSSS